MTPEEEAELRAAMQKAASFSTVALWIAVAALALAVLGLFMPLPV